MNSNLNFGIKKHKHKPQKRFGREKQNTSNRTAIKHKSTTHTDQTHMNVYNGQKTGRENPKHKRKTQNTQKRLPTNQNPSHTPHTKKGTTYNNLNNRTTANKDTNMGC